MQNPTPLLRWLLRLDKRRGTGPPHVPGLMTDDLTREPVLPARPRCRLASFPIPDIQSKEGSHYREILSCAAGRYGKVTAVAQQREFRPSAESCRVHSISRDQVFLSAPTGILHRGWKELALESEVGVVYDIMDGKLSLLCDSQGVALPRYIGSPTVPYCTL